MTSAFGLEALAFAPHPDDAELFCGGLLLRLGDLGYRTGVVDLTRGEAASRGTVAVRAEETARASQVLGLQVRDNLGLPDTGLRAGDEAQVRALVACLRQHRPELVIAPWERERHPDHEACSALVTRAVFLAGLRNHAPELGPAVTPRQVLYYPQRQLATPSFVVDVSDQADRKRQAILCHASQVLPDPGAAPTLVGSNLAIPSLEARDRFYGAHIGVAFGEPYVVRPLLGLHDPIDHFRRNSWAIPHFLPERA